MTDQLADIKARLAAATPGPWEWENDGDGRTLVTADEAVLGGAILWARDDNDFQIDLLLGDEDAAFISAAWDDVRWLVAEVERLRAERDELIEHIVTGYFGKADALARHIKSGENAHSEL